jgi:hypothetical protein
MKPIEAKKLSAYLSGEDLSFIRLIGEDKNVIVSFNKDRRDVKKQIEKFDRALNSKMNPDGLYYVEYRSIMSGKPSRIAVQKGSAEIEPEKIVLSDDQEKPFLSYREALAYEKKIIELESRNKELEAQIKQYELEDSAPELAETPNNLEAYSQIANLVAPFAERILTIFEKKIESKPAPMQTYVQQAPPENDEYNKLVEMIRKATPDECYNLLVSTSQTDKESFDLIRQVIIAYRPDSNIILKGGE